MKENVKVTVKTDLPEAGIHNDKKVMEGQRAVIVVQDGEGKTSVMTTGMFTLVDAMDVVMKSCQAIREGLTTAGVSPVVADCAIRAASNVAIKGA